MKIYDVLLQIQNTPIVLLNRAVAVVETGVPELPLATVDEVARDGQLD